MRAFAILTLVATLVVAPQAAHAKRQNIILSFGQDVLLVGGDDISVRAQCVQNEGGLGYDYLRVYAVTANDAVLRGAFMNHLGDGDYLAPGASIFDSTLVYYYTTSGTEAFYAMPDAGGVLNLTTMHGFGMNSESTVLGLNSNGNDCVLSIDLNEVRKFKETF